MRRGARASSTSCAERAEHVAVEGDRQFNPGWHLALDLRNMLLVSECVAQGGAGAQESRGGHTRDDYPAMDADVAQALNLVCRARRRRRRATLDAPADADADAAGPARPVRASTSWRSTSPTKSWPSSTRRRRQRSEHDATSAQLPGLARRRRRRRAAATTPSRSTRARSCSTSSTGCRPPRPATSPCAGTARPASAARAAPEINGRPRLMCMTRMSTFDRGRDDHGHAAARPSR